MTSETFKIVAVDNYGRENVADTLISEGISKEAAELLATRLNNEAGKDSDSYYVVQPASYKLWRGMEEFV